MDLMQWNWWLNSGGGGSPTPESMWGPDGDNSLVFHLDATNTFLNYIGFLNVVQYPIEYSDTDGDMVTYSLMSGYAGIGASVGTLSRSPLLGSDSESSGFLDFGNPNTTKYLQCIESKKVLKGFHKVSPVFNVHLRVKKETDGTIQTLIDSTNSTTANSGIRVIFTAANKITIQVYFSTPGQSVINYTSTASVLVADGWTDINVSSDGSGVSSGKLRIKKIGGVLVEENFTVHATNGGTADATGELVFGSQSITNSNYFPGKIERVLSRDAACSLSDFDFIFDYRPARSKRELLIPLSEFDADSLVYSDTLLTPITDGGKIQTWGNQKTTPFADPERYMLQATLANKPTYVASDPAINNKPNAIFYGLDNVSYPANNSFMAENNEIFPRAGFPIHTFVVVGKQNKTNPGGYYFSGVSTGYAVEVGTAYVSNPRPDSKSYFVQHYSANNSLGTDFLTPNQGGYNVFIWSYNIAEGTATTWDGNGVKTIQTGKLKQIITVMARIGFTWRPAEQDWWLDGAIPHFEAHYGQPSDAWALSKIAALRTKFGIPIGTY